MLSDSQQAAVGPRWRINPRHDLESVADLWVASWRATTPAIDFVARRDWFCATVEAIEGAGGATLCAYDTDDALAGFVLLDVQRNVLEQIAVAPPRFGSGVAGLLLDHAKALCPAGLGLTVNADNPRALRFYEKHGFGRQRPGVNPNSGLPTWHMRWPHG